jgi:hypothetical protein
MQHSRTLLLLSAKRRQGNLIAHVSISKPMIDFSVENCLLSDAKQKRYEVPYQTLRADELHIPLNDLS